MDDLSEYERTVYRMLLEAASKGLPCPSNLDIEMELGCNSSSVPPTIIKNLEEKHRLIAVTRYQRAREVTVFAVGRTTAPHPDRKTDRPHVPRGTATT